MAARRATKAAPKDTKLVVAPATGTIDALVVDEAEAVGDPVETVPLAPLPVPEPTPEPVPVPAGLDAPLVTVALGFWTVLPEPPTPALTPGLPLSAPLAEATAESELRMLDAALPEALTAAVFEEAADEAADELDTLLQDRSYKGVVVKVLPTIPKLGAGVVGAESWRVYHQTLVFPNRGQPASSQYVLAFSVEAMARFAAGPLTGHPVSVIQTSLLPTAAWVALTASLKRPGPFSIELACVFWKYG